MQVDQAGRDELARRVEEPARPRRCNVCVKGHDFAVANTDVTLAAQRLAWVEHIAALDHEIEFFVRALLRLRSSHAERHRERAGACPSEELAARRICGITA